MKTTAQLILWIAYICIAIIACKDHQSAQKILTHLKIDQKDGLLPVSESESPSANDSSMRQPDFTLLFKKLSPAVVNIFTETLVEKSPLSVFRRNMMQNPGAEETIPALGTGFIIDIAGYILTNHHVIENAKSIQVRLLDDTSWPAKIVGFDKRTDLALLKINPMGNTLIAVGIGDSVSTKIGEWVMAIGNPFGLTHTLTVGIVSSVSRQGVSVGDLTYFDFIQTDCSINPGNSGGPLFNMQGNVIGINTAINGQGQGIGFSIPIHLAMQIVPILKKHGAVAKTWVGITIDQTPDTIVSKLGAKQPQGVLVLTVTPEGPGEKSGIQVGDIILKFADTPITSREEIRWVAMTAGVGEIVKVKLWRQGQVMEVDLQIEAQQTQP